MTELRRQVTDIERLGEAYRPFADKVRALIHDFADEQIVALADRYLDE